MSLLESFCVFWCPRPALTKVLQHRAEQAEMNLYDALADAIHAKHQVNLQQELRDVWRTLAGRRGLTSGVSGAYNPPITAPDNLPPGDPYGPPSQS